MNRAGASARAKARQLTREKVNRASGIAGAAAFGGAVLGLTDGPAVAVAGGVLGALGGAAVGLRGVRAAGTRWRQGAAGERRTSKAVRSLTKEGWRTFDDLSIPRSRANLDHLWVTPSGSAVVVGDTKAWHANNAKVRMNRTDLFYGPWCQAGTVRTIEWETSRVAEALGVPAISVLVLDGAVVDRKRHPGGWIQVSPTFWVVEQGSLLETLRSVSYGPANPRAARSLAKKVGKEFPPYSKAAK